MGGGIDDEARFMFSFPARRHKCSTPALSWLFIARGADLNGSACLYVLHLLLGNNSAKPCIQYYTCFWAAPAKCLGQGPHN